ncbi:hypothetical protein RvY_01264-2 [Ramazzottius varieornatus]|uniref:Rubicon Homology domain-containing protein n=1 Tax=Ramazzottius varieornatus TaxID=947166 RepID=A0A1D1ULS3_RAMVA|nr:hypothetical protein RvY_01264-2 [Ramazzottius varieornatus]
MADSAKDDHDLQTILALYDSSDLLTKLEDAARVLSEMVPSGLVEREDVLDDALAVVCSDLTQILQLGIKDRSLSKLMGYMEELISQSTGKPVNFQPEARQDSIASSREKLFDLVVSLLRSAHSRQRFLATVDDSHSTLMDLYESFAPLRSEGDRLRILKALQLLPHVDEPSPTESLSELPSNNGTPPSVSNGRNCDNDPCIEAAAECPPESPKLPRTPTARPLIAKAHARSRSDVDYFPSSSRPATSRKPNGVTNHHRRLSTASSLPDSRSVESVSIFSSSYFSPPRKGQSLIGYLKSQDTVTCADLERENAHFFISEAIIAAVQCVQYEQRHGCSRVYDETANYTGSDEPVPNAPNSFADILPDVPLQSVSDESVSVTPEPSACTDGGEWRLQDVEHSSNSAEAIAISLLKHFSASQLPKASDLDWIISEFETPQGLLSLSRGVPAERDLAEADNCRLRGTLEWAPLRPQVIYHIQTPVALNTAMAQQKNRCAGCGGKKDVYNQSKMRYCDYTGKYFCVLCHEYKQAIIPARVLLKWDFSKHYVSNFAADFLAKIYRDPLFDVSHCR